jgi:membrane associated rhomboid family serine protease
MGIWDNIKSTFKKGSSLIQLIYINIAFFLVISIIGIIGFLVVNPEMSNQTIRFLSVPSSFTTLLYRPWTLITYMFTHKELLHIVVNLLWLYWFGSIFLEYFDQKKLVAVYILGGLAGGITYVLSYNIFPAFSGVVKDSIPLLGASASVMAIVVAIAAYVPDYTVMLFLLGRVKIKYIAIVVFILTSVLDFSVNSGGKLAHIGGAVFGYIYTLSYRQGHDLGKWLNKIIDSVVTLFKPSGKMQVTYKRKAADVFDMEYNRKKTEHQEEINKILEKISKGGYDSLTKEEKEMLFKESQK